MVLRVEADAVRARRVQVAEERLLPAAEREEGHRRGDADVDAEHAGLRSALERARRGPRAREDRGRVAVARGVEVPDRLVERVGAHDGQHRTEQLGAPQLHRLGHVVEERRAEEEPLVARALAAVDDERGAGLLPLRDRVGELGDARARG